MTLRLTTGLILLDANKTHRIHFIPSSVDLFAFIPRWSSLTTSLSEIDVTDIMACHGVKPQILPSSDREMNDDLLFD